MAEYNNTIANSRSLPFTDPGFNKAWRGSYFLAISPGPGRAPLRMGLNVPYSDEFRVRAANETALKLADFLAGTKPHAPVWVQRSGIEWLFRWITEPGRLTRRYARYPLFAAMALRELVGKRRGRDSA